MAWWNACNASKDSGWKRGIDMAKERTCKVCGRTFAATRGQLYCDECKRLGRHPPKKCRVCGRPFIPVDKGKHHGTATTCCDDCAARIAAGEKAKDIRRDTVYSRIDTMQKAARAAGVSYGVKLYAN